MSRERFNAKSDQQLVANLTDFLYARDYLFASGTASRTEQSAKRVFKTPTDDPDIYLPTEKEILTIVGERNIPVKKGRDTNQPSDFTVSYKHTTFTDEVPPQIRHLLSQDVVAQYDNTEPGDLSEVHHTEYYVSVTEDGIIYINREISYQLRDIKSVIHKVRESDISPKKLVRVRTPESIEDGELQASIVAEFNTYITNELGAMEQYWVDDELTIQIGCINAIMNSLVSGRPIAKVD